MKLIFAVLYVLLTMGLIRCYRTEGLLHLLHFIGQIFAFHRVPLFNTFVRGEPLHSGSLNLAIRHWKHLFIVGCEKYFDILYHVDVMAYECDRQTDRQTRGL